MDNQPENINDRNINESVSDRKPSGRKSLIWLIAAAAVMIIAGVIFGISAYRNNKALEDAQNEKEQLMLDMEKLQLDRDFDDLNREFAQFENSRSLIMDDSVKRALTEKYETARLQVEALQQELKTRNRRAPPKSPNSKARSRPSAPCCVTMSRKSTASIRKTRLCAPKTPRSKTRMHASTTKSPRHRVATNS